MAATKSKIKPATPETAYSETVKAVQLIERIEQEKRKEVPHVDRLRMVNQALENARTRQEAEDLASEKKELELALKYPQWEKLNFPEDKRDIVRENYRIEAEQGDALLHNLYAQLEQAADALAAAVPLLEQLEQVEGKKAVASLVETILADEVEVLPGSNVPSMSFTYKMGGDPAHYIRPYTDRAAKFSAALKALAQSGQRKTKGDNK
ncbi:hypothetical protein [Bhargavaea beijingensis]|uniref:Phage minor structural protein GP20 n=1 Tax=Bhargavaea beijingensis TaxID=426756 RepID=A0ABX9ZC82_9BACL|nr:hypothetical protein [Bhargavaea beijingensis]RSK30967.1 hypothetical protein EJA12_09630 [Bhargavaea beijingensis]